jgi:hypothetical protein
MVNVDDNRCELCWTSYRRCQIGRHRSQIKQCKHVSHACIMDISAARSYSNRRHRRYVDRVPHIPPGGVQTAILYCDLAPCGALNNKGRRETLAQFAERQKLHNGI